jgi:hypothetical protein
MPRSWRVEYRRDLSQAGVCVVLQEHKAWDVAPAVQVEAAMMSESNNPHNPLRVRGRNGIGKWALAL